MSLQQAREQYEWAVTACAADRMDCGFITAPRRAQLAGAWSALYQAVVSDYASGMARTEPIGGSLAARPMLEGRAS